MTSYGKLAMLGLCTLFLLHVAGCGGSGTPSAPSAPSPTAAKAANTTTASATAPTSAAPAAANVPAAARPASLDAVKAAPETGTIVGWVGYDGPAPKPRPINFGADIVCGNMHKEKPALEETLVLNENHTVKWAVVSIRGDVPGEHKIPETPAVLDQVGCIFTPHVVALMAGQEIEYKNSDPVSHNIRGTPKKNQAFNNIYAPNMTSKARFDKAEIGIPIKCDIHFWMASYIHVFPHPFFAVTGDDGAFVLSGLPPGKYTIQLWHEKLRPQTHAVEVAAGEVKELPLTLSAGN